MVDPLIPDDPGLLSSILDELALPGQAVRNVIGGNWEGVGRNALDFAGNLIDATLPGDWIPELSRPEDKLDTSDLIGGMEDGSWSKFGVNLVGNTLLDPLTYIPGGVVAKGLRGVGAAGRTALKAADTLAPTLQAERRFDAGKMATKSALGWLEPDMPEVANALGAGSATKSMVNQAGMKEVERVLKGTTDTEREDLFNIMQNIQKSKGGIVGQLAPIQATGFMTPGHQLEEFVRRSAMTGKDPAHIQRLNDLAEQYIPYAHGQWAEGVKGNVFSPAAGIAEIPDPLGNIIKQPWEINAEEMSPGLYAQRSFSDEALATKPGVQASTAQALKPRELQTGQDIADELNFGGMAKGTELESDLATAATKRAEQQGSLMGKAAIAKSLLGDEFKSLSDPVSKAKMAEVLDNLASADPEGAVLLRNAWEGLPARGNVMEALHRANTIFKPSAVYGIGVPRVGGIVKNITSFPMQLAAEGEGKQALAQLGRTPANLYEAGRKLVEGYGGKLPAGALGQDGDLIEQALGQAGGRAENALQALEQAGRPDLADALKHGVVGGFVSAEGAQNSIRQSGTAQKVLGKLGASPATSERISNALDAPAKSFQGAEQFARLGNFQDIYKDLIAQGIPREEAARTASQRVGNALYDYSVKTPENRAMRDVIPFAAFQTNAIRQSAKALANNPWAAVAASNVIGQQGDSPIYNSMNGKVNIPIGRDASGNQTYISSLGLPIEALSNIPNPSADLYDIGRQIEQGIVGSSHPLLKSAYGLVSGRDPYQGSDYGTYSKVGGQDLGSAGRAINKIIGTGLVQPISGPIQQIGKLLDDHGTLGSDLVDLATGVNTVSVDENQALRQRLEEALKRDPEIRKYVTLYQQGDDPDAKQLLQALAVAKEKIKQKQRLSAQTGSNHVNQ